MEERTNQITMRTGWDLLLWRKDEQNFDYVQGSAAVPASRISNRNRYYLQQENKTRLRFRAA